MPGGTYCAVSGCFNHTLMPRSEIRFHSFPRGKDFSGVRDEWVARCGRRSKLNTLTSRVCSAHFTPDDYERDLKHELLDLPSRHILKRTAIPTQELGKKVVRQKSESPIAHAKRKKMINDLLDDSIETASPEEKVIEIPDPAGTHQSLDPLGEVSDVSRNNEEVSKSVT